MTTLLSMILLFVLSVICVTNIIDLIAKKLDRKVSVYLTFGIATGICCLIVTAIALYDILTPGGDLNGMFGQILLMVYIPTAAVMMIGDIIVRRINTKKKTKDDR